MFSLVLATISRVTEVERFFRSLSCQTLKDIELVLVDQNTDGRLDGLIESYSNYFPIVHLRSTPGLSHARNLGLKSISGNIVAFPDDDCWYPSDLLSHVASLMKDHPDWDGITGTAQSEEGGLSRYHWDSEPGPITQWNVWKRGISFSIFLRRKVILNVGSFDEKIGLGAGTPWGSGEETDYLLRGIKTGMKINFQPDIVVYHDDHIPSYNVYDIIKGRKYGGGAGYIMRKHHYPLHWAFAELGRPLAISILSFLTYRWSRSKYFFAVFQGHLGGYLTGDQPQ